MIHKYEKKARTGGAPVYLKCRALYKYQMINEWDLNVIRVIGKVICICLSGL